MKDQPRSNKKKRIDTSSEFFYSETLHKYIPLDFLKVDERIVVAANKLHLKLDWDDEGRICNISFIDAKRLIDVLGSHLLTPAEYWQVYEEIRKSGNNQMLSLLQSNTATEWLDAVFERNANGVVYMTGHPKIKYSSGKAEFVGDRRKIIQPVATPGWFNPTNNIDKQTGMPLRVETRREKGSPSWSETTWKYWSTFKVGYFVAGIRGYVTSSGTPSLDMGIPVENTQRFLMIRECRDKLVIPELPPQLLAKAKRLIEAYIKTTVGTPGIKNPKEHEKFYGMKETVFKFLTKCRNGLFTSRGKEAREIQEKLIDMLGILKIEALRKKDNDTIKALERITPNLFPRPSKFGFYHSLVDFLEKSRERLKKAISENKPIVFVMGHKNPDTDTVISSLFEAYRNFSLDQTTCFVPLVQASRIPDEIKRLLGQRISNGFLLSTEKIYQQALALGQARWIMVDHSRSEQQKFTISIVDHHILSTTAARQAIPKTWEMIGSCSAQITQKIFGVGIVPDQEMARLLQGAALMDTENRGPKKMTYKDELIMDALRAISGIQDENRFYQDLMSSLLNTDDPTRLFERDYKEDWGIFGFAVAKVKNVFDTRGDELKPELLIKIVSEAERNNKQKNFCLTIVKVVDYEDDNERVNRERVYLVFNDYAPEKFRAVTFECLERIIRHEFGERVKIRRLNNAVEFWGVGDQLSRKVTAPTFEPIVSAFNEYYYSPAIGVHVKRDFLRVDEEITSFAKELGIKLYTDKEGRVCNITFNEAKCLLDSLGFTMLSLPEYWRVLSEVTKVNDVQMNQHLRSRGFVEFLDTVILDHQFSLNHPHITGSGENITYKGKINKVEIPVALPALIYPNEIDQKTGLPTKTYEAQESYADVKAWRYWSPDAPVCIPTRGYIFLIDKPALDLKIHPNDALPNLGIRVAAKKLIYPNIEFQETKKGLEIKIVRPRTAV